MEDEPARTPQEDDPHYRLVRRGIAFLARRYRDQPTLDDLATHLGMSPYHAQRVFKRWTGVSPKRFLQYVTLEHAKDLLRESETVLEAAWGAGLSGSGRLHDLFVTVEGVTPGQYRREGSGVVIRWGVHPTPFGEGLFALTDRGLTALEFLPTGGAGPALRTLEESWPRASVVEAPEATAPVARRIFGDPGAAASASTSPALVPEGDAPPALRLHVHGTNFQIRVWEALLRVPPGSVVAYSDLARAAGHPDAARAVGSALGRNPVAVVIPCHRVLRRNGRLGGYRWGEERKRALLAWESARHADTEIGESP